MRSRSDRSSSSAAELDPAVEQALTALVRDERRRVLATLVRTPGSIDAADEAVSDAVERAWRTWPRDGVPASPRAWLTVTARRCAVDRLRREAARQSKEVEAVRLHALSAEDPVPTSVRDDQLRLLFTCCHPALAREAQVALALRLLCGLGTDAVARALLVSEATMARRLSRAKDKIAKAAIPYRVPDDAALPERLTAVANVVYLVFTEGHRDAAAASLADESLRLARLLVELMPDEARALGLLALICLQHARHPARHGGELLSDQDRSLWDRALMGEGLQVLGRALARTPDQPDPYVVQAAIAACHDLAPTWEQTDWSAIISWYDVLLSLDGSPVVGLNRAVAVAERDGPEAGLALMDGLSGLETYGLWHASRAELLSRNGCPADAVLAAERALRCPLSEAERRLVAERLARDRAGAAASGPTAGP